MTKRRFAPRCGKCRLKTMALVTIQYSIQIDHDGRKYNVVLPSLTVPKCSNCGDLSIDGEAERQIDTAFRQQASLLTAEQIRQRREALGLTQKAIANCLGIGEATWSRWETGAQIQQRAMNTLVRAYFELPALRNYLESSQDTPEPPKLSADTTACAEPIEGPPRTWGAEPAEMPAIPCPSIVSVKHTEVPTYGI